MKHVVTFGDIAEGFKLVGPFDSPEQAQDYMLDHSKDGYYDMLPLEEPEAEFMPPAFPVPAYSIGHRFFMMQDNKVTEMKVCHVEVAYSDRFEPVFRYGACPASESFKADYIYVFREDLELTTKQKLLDSL